MTALVGVGPLTVTFRDVSSRHWASKRCIDPFKVSTSEFYKCESQLYHKKRSYIFQAIHESVKKAGQGRAGQGRAGQGRAGQDRA